MSMAFNKNKLLSGSVTIGNKGNQIPAEEEDFDNLALTVCNPNNLRMTAIEEMMGNKKPLNLKIEEFLGLKEDDMIINNS